MNDSIPGVTYVRTASGLHALGRPSMDAAVVVPATSRTNPTRGTYLSNNPLYTGTLPGHRLQDMNQIFAGSTGMITLTSPNQIPDNSVIWGGIVWKIPTEHRPKNIAIAGPRPDLKKTDGCVRSYAATETQGFLDDSLIDPGLWLDPTLAGYDTWSVPADYLRYPGDKLEFWREFNRVPGLHGGSMHMRRVEIRNCVDTVNNLQVPGKYTRFEDCWLHDQHYYRDPAVVTQTGGWHSDGFQFAYGTDISILGGYIGGKRGYFGEDTNLTPQADLTQLHYNPGHDPKNAGLMIKQETAHDPLGNILIDGVVFEGGDYCINHYYSTVNVNQMATVRFQNLKFVKIPDDAPTGNNRQAGYILRNSAYAACYDVPTMRLITLDGVGGWTDVGQAPINNG